MHFDGLPLAGGGHARLVQHRRGVLGHEPLTFVARAQNHRRLTVRHARPDGEDVVADVLHGVVDARGFGGRAVEFDDLELKNSVTYDLGNGLKAFGQLDFGFKDAAEDKQSGSKLEEAYMGVDFVMAAVAVGKQNKCSRRIPNSHNKVSRLSHLDLVSSYLATL